LEIKIRKLTSGLWSHLYNSTVTLLQTFFSWFVKILVCTSYLQIHLVKIAFATVSGVLSEMATNSLYFENALVKLKMYLLLFQKPQWVIIKSWNQSLQTLWG